MQAVSWRTTRAAAHTEPQNRQVAVIDLGSNSWRLVVFTFNDGPPARWWMRTDELYETVRIGRVSLQLVGVSDRRAEMLSSLPLGAVRLTEQFLPGDGPARKKEIEALREHVRGELDGLPWLTDSGSRLVGIGGAVRNLADA